MPWQDAILFGIQTWNRTKKYPWIKMVGYQLDDHHQIFCIEKWLYKKSPNVHPFSKKQLATTYVSKEGAPFIWTKKKTACLSQWFSERLNPIPGRTEKTTNSMVGWTEKTIILIWIYFINNSRVDCDFNGLWFIGLSFKEHVEGADFYDLVAYVSIWDVEPKNCCCWTWKLPFKKGDFQVNKACYTRPYFWGGVR